MHLVTTKNTTTAKTMADLEHGDCRWPIGDPRHDGFHFCGAKQMAGRPYCTEHWNMAFVPSKARAPGSASSQIALIAFRKAA